MEGVRGLGKNRVFSSDFRVGIARRIVNGESVTAIHHALGIKQSVLYRWRDAYLKDGEEGLRRSAGRPPGTGTKLRSAATAAGAQENPAYQQAASDATAKRMAELEQVIGKQALYIDFLTGAFKRLKESRRKNGATGETASTRRSGQ